MITDRGDPGKIPDYVRVKGIRHVVSYLHVPNRGSLYEKGGISP